MKKILTIILDGFGMREDIYGNAIKNAGMNNFINIWNKYPHSLLKASGEEIGLQDKQFSSSEFGHKLLGAGRMIKDNLSIVRDNLKSNKQKNNEVFNKLINRLKDTDGDLHLITLLSDGGISSHIDNIYMIEKILEEKKLNTKIYIHAIADGKDSGKFTINKYIDELEEKINDNTKLSTVCGRYYALDTTKDYNRTKLYYDLIVYSKGVDAPNINKVIELCYSKKMTDEYIAPLKTVDYKAIEQNDTVLFLNLNSRPYKQLFESLCEKKYKKFYTSSIDYEVFTLFPIDKELNENYIFDEETIKTTLGEYLSILGLSQARIGESAKKDSLTKYFDGERKIKIDNCDLYIADSKFDVTIDKKPEMNALTIAKTAITCMEKDYDFVIVNFANADEIGHTGNYQATINGLQAIDICLGKMIECADENFYKVVIVGSHGNADTIIDRDNNIITQNTLSPVPFIIMDKKIKLKNGKITDFAPTLLKYMDIAIPKEMKKEEILIEK